jgi:hypothetical protein
VGAVGSSRSGTLVLSLEDMACTVLGGRATGKGGCSLPVVKAGTETHKSRSLNQPEVSKLILVAFI